MRRSWCVQVRSGLALRRVGGTTRKEAPGRVGMHNEQRCRCAVESEWPRRGPMQGPASNEHHGVEGKGWHGISRRLQLAGPFAGGTTICMIHGCESLQTFSHLTAQVPSALHQPRPHPSPHREVRCRLIAALHLEFSPNGIVTAPAIVKGTLGLKGASHIRRQLTATPHLEA